MRTKRVRHIVDILLGIGLILLMSYQVAGEEGHELLPSWNFMISAERSSSRSALTEEDASVRA